MVSSQKLKKKNKNLFQEIGGWLRTMVVDRLSSITERDYKDYLNGKLNVGTNNDKLILYRGDEQIARLALWGDLSDVKKYEYNLEGSNTRAG